MKENKEQKLDVLLCKYQYAYDILMDTFDYLPHDVKIKTHNKLNKIGL